MPRFKDTTGHLWPICITLPDMRRVRDELKIDMLDPSETTFVKLLDNPETIVDLLSVLLTPQIQAQGLTAEDFARRLAGDVLDAAADAMLEALVDFFPKRRRAMLTAALMKTRDWMERATEHAVTTIHSPKLEKMFLTAMDLMNQEMEKGLSGKLSTSGSPSEASDPNPD